MLTGDGAYIKKINRSFILNTIFEHYKISRANLSKITGLNKATISVQVNDLLKNKLIYETREEHKGLGRTPILLSINERASYFLGVDLDRDHILFNITDLKGDTVKYKKLELQTDVFEEIVSILAKQIKAYKEEYAFAQYGLAQTIIAIHGTITNEGELHFVPSYQWRDVNIKEELAKHGVYDVHVENNANLSAYAEKAIQYNQSNNLLNINLASGIGAGIIINGELHKGFHGHAGEMGHMIVYPDGRSCRCGNKGCWEKYASEPVFFNYANNTLQDPIRSDSDFKKMLDKGDEHILASIKNWIQDIAIGLNNVINLYNPEMIVLNSPILKAYPDSLKEIEKHLHSSVCHYREIVLSALGAKAGVIGACAMGIQHFLELPRLTLSETNNCINNEKELTI
ncbi:ROK family protein [Gracilibacillus sp. YIM 98692]|uniref:ROK family protein n=1 Tax=Gracilibacillus sp. YIM 98692 TaxID=2663532 RepID=UPI0013D2A436|nr:ROK family protein [Gracilibacillus sp. YIM 98692]